ncbi:MAG: hypothetical protein HKN26_12285 [Acidimicrobiales bacterium]|nr:hypothetical protein [Acidimicrobiales bacterium]
MAPKVSMPGFSAAARAKVTMAWVLINPRSAAPTAPATRTGATVARASTMSWSAVNRFHRGVRSQRRNGEDPPEECLALTAVGAGVEWDGRAGRARS